MKPKEGCFILGLTRSEARDQVQQARHADSYAHLIIQNPDFLWLHRNTTKQRRIAHDYPPVS
jgi:hypothetical protein